jgi:hypothetical protein
MFSENDIKSIVREELRNLFGPRVAVINSVNSDHTSVRCTPLVRQPLMTAENNEARHTALSEVEAPIVVPAGATQDRLHVSLSPGNLVLLINLQFDHRAVLEDGSTVVGNPLDPSTYEQDFVVALPFTLASPAKGDADVALLGDSVRLGRQGSWDALVKESSQININTAWGFLKPYILAAAAAGGEPPAPLFPSAPQLDVTTNTQAS